MEKREGCSASKLLGLRESKGLRIWLIVATFLSIIANFIVVIGCMSPATLPLHLYRVDRPALASALSNISHLNLTELDSPELPDSWYWGMSGVCAVYEAEDSTRCWRSFPPTTGLDELVEMSLKSHLGNASDTNDTQPVLSAWKEASSISNINSSKKRTHFIALSKGSATLAILSLLVGIGLFCISVASMTERFKEKPKLWILYLISILDGSMFLGSGIMSILAIKSSFCSILFSPKAESLNTGLLDGPGIDVLFGGVFLKFAAVGILLVGFLIVVFLSLMFAVACCAACCGGERRYYIDADTHHELVEV